MPSHIVYQAKSNLTGMVYIGCTRKSLEQRKAEHHRDAFNGSPFKFHRALKNASDSFAWSVVAVADSQREVFALERRHIAMRNSYAAGYNSTPGGAPEPGRVYSTSKFKPSSLKGYLKPKYKRR